jgi:hypothetical protein
VRTTCQDTATGATLGVESRGSKLFRAWEGHALRSRRSRDQGIAHDRRLRLWRPTQFDLLESITSSCRFVT